MPKVSVIISTYNRSSFLCDAIDSALNQAFQGLEIIVIDDGSSDDTKQALEKYDSIIYVYQENKGRAEARNSGIKLAMGEYIAFLDDDDIWLPNKIEKQVAFLGSNPDIGLVHTLTEMMDERGARLPRETKKRLGLYNKAMRLGYTYQGMSGLCIMFLSSVMIRRGCLREADLFDPAIKAFEDWDFYLRFSLKYRIGTILEPLVKFRLHKMQTTREEFVDGRIKTAKKHLDILEGHKDTIFYRKSRYHLLMHLVNAYYIALDKKNFFKWNRELFRSFPCALFRWDLVIHLLVTLLPFSMIKRIRYLNDKKRFKHLFFVERIIPDETTGASLATHLNRYEFIKQFCAGKVVLDAACGVGYGASLISTEAKKTFGIDISKEAIIFAKERYERENIDFKIMDVYSLGFPDAHFDIIASFETIEHLAYTERFLLEVKRVLKDDGIFILSAPHVKKTTYNPRYPHHKIEFSRKDFESLLKRYFNKVEIFGQRRLQSGLHLFLQSVDIFHLRALLPIRMRRKVCHLAKTNSWDESNIKDFIIDQERIERALSLVGVCRK